MTGARSKTRSRCDCGHRIELVNGKWQHVEPHPEHACTCREPKPSDRITGPRLIRKAEWDKFTPCGIATLNSTMERREGYLPGES